MAPSESAGGQERHIHTHTHMSNAPSRPLISLLLLTRAQLRWERLQQQIFRVLVEAGLLNAKWERDFSVSETDAQGYFSNFSIRWRAPASFAALQKIFPNYETRVSRAGGSGEEGKRKKEDRTEKTTIELHVPRFMPVPKWWSWAPKVTCHEPKEKKLDFLYGGIYGSRTGPPFDHYSDVLRKENFSIDEFNEKPSLSFCFIVMETSICFVMENDLEKNDFWVKTEYNFFFLFRKNWRFRWFFSIFAFFFSTMSMLM